MNTHVNKQELIDWISNLTDSATLESIKFLKENKEAPTIHWDDLPEVVKAGIKRGREDMKAGRVITNEEFWKAYEHRL